VVREAGKYTPSCARKKRLPVLEYLQYLAAQEEAYLSDVKGRGQDMGRELYSHLFSTASELPPDAEQQNRST
jgi:hypothetical protein